jgi:hypothetical protein
MQQYGGSVFYAVRATKHYECCFLCGPCRVYIARVVDGTRWVGEIS